MIPERYAPHVYALFRIVAGFMFIFHGLQKFGMLGGQAMPLASMMGVAAVIESVGGLLIMIGLFTRPAAFIASGEMADA
jgi:putative oxidoreductase